MNRPASEAVGRVMQAASDLAVAETAKCVYGRHLLAALWDDESRAQEILEQAGITDEGIAMFVGANQADGRRVGEAPAEPMSPDTTSHPLRGSAGASPSHELSLSRSVEEAIRLAQSFAAQSGRHAELGTEHLLMGLVETDAEIASWMEEQGVSSGDLRRKVTGAQGLSDEPIAVDIALHPVVRAGREAVRVDRILDAAANRCREGLRVVEDFVRFVLDDAHLSRLLKGHRHQLAAALDLLPTDRILAARDTAGDVGTGIQTQAEQHREHAVDVVRANCKRVEESLRTLEEYSKTVNADAAVRFEQLRYGFYTIEQAVMQTFRSRDRLRDVRLYLLVTDRLCPQGAGPVIRKALKGGVDVVQLREKEMPDRRLLDLAKSVREWTAEANALFIVNDRPDIAAACDADGVHLGQDDMYVRDARQIIGGDKLIGVSTHTIEQARQAVLDGADYLGVGPVFPSQTKAFEDFPGLAFVKEVAAEITRPWYPLGGIDESNICEVVADGASRVAVSSAITSSNDPSATAATLRAALQ